MKLECLPACIGLLFLASCARQQAPVTSAPSPDNRQPVAARAPASPEALYVYFATNSAVLNGDARKVADQAAGLYRQRNPGVMNVVGHTDPAGDEFYNLVLSARRAKAVKVALVDRGIPAKVLQIQALGESDPAVPPDAPGREAAKERRAVITWHP